MDKVIMRDNNLIIKMWFSYKLKHSFHKENFDILIYYRTINEKDFDNEYFSNSEWQLILSKTEFWIWKPELKKIEKINIENVRHLLGKFHKKSKKEYSQEYKVNSTSIIKKYLKNPLSIKKLLVEMNIFDIEKKSLIERELSSSGEKEFYLAKWVQNLFF